MGVGIGVREIIEILMGVLAVLGGVIAIVRGAVGGILKQNSKLIDGVLVNMSALATNLTNHMHEDQKILVDLSVTMAVQTEVLRSIQKDTNRMEETQQRIDDRQERRKSQTRHR